jgi:hypothetical protein
LRSDEYCLALEHYERAIAICARRDINHRNLARTLVNAAYVKGLLALHLRKRIESKVLRSNQGSHVKENYHARHASICQEALAQLERAGQIYRLHEPRAEQVRCW